MEGGLARDRLQFCAAAIYAAGLVTRRVMSYNGIARYCQMTLTGIDALCAQVITIGALIMELAAAVVLGATVLTYDYFNSKDSYF